MSPIKKISHASYETPDLEQQTEYYTEVIGLSVVSKSPTEVFLASKIDPHSIVLRKGDEAKCTSLGFQIAPEGDLDALQKHVEGHQISTSRKSDAEPGLGDMLTFKDFKGTNIEIFRAPEPTSQPYSYKGMAAHKLGHVAFHVEDVQAATKWYTEVLGFRVSDWMGDFFSFLRCGHDHHTLNLVGTGKNQHFHTAFELRDWSHMQTSSDLLSRHGYKIIWGPGRHGIGHNLFTYHKGPNGLITELFAELDQMTSEELGYFEPRPWHRDNPQRPKVWEKGPGSANLWGPPPPDELLKV